MVTSIGVLECPFCDEIFEVKSPDKIRTAFSTAKPMPKSDHVNVVGKKHKCQNPKCKKTITVYWYSPIEYLNRI